MLLESRYISERDLEKALVIQSQIGGRLGSILVRSGALSETNLLSSLSEQLQIPIVGEGLATPAEQEISQALEETKLPVSWLISFSAVIWSREEYLYCISKDILSSELEEELLRSSPLPIRFCLARDQQLDSLLVFLQGVDSENSGEDLNSDIQQLREMAEEAPVIELVNTIISLALEDNASDIHIEPEADTYDIRYRVDGVLNTNRTLPIQKYHAVASRLKLISGLDIAERRLPQDGQISTRISGHDLDVRVSTLPGIFGESIVMRLMPKERGELSLDRLGLLPDHLEMMSEWVRTPHGIVLVTGPTGSGKSTTLYSALDGSNDGLRKIITVEDPVEYKLQHITQVQVQADIGLTFSAALRSILRQDPDVIMIGEIRDLETAEIAVQSALTGHLVLSTLHTNDSMGAFTRLVDMGVEPFLVATPVLGVQAQRLVRKLCECSAPCESLPVVSEEVLRLVEKFYPGKQPDWREPVGCKKCQQSGYKGRLGIYELVTVSDEMRKMVVKGASLTELRDQARLEGFRDLCTDGLIKACLGLTSIEEVYRVSSLN
ncbi:MAG: Flp pilus assembly complex ATPase component TadA [Cellvibrionaceae bacterium]